MANYKQDRSFTDYVHEHLAVPQIYSELGWSVESVPPDVLASIDMHLGVDYVVSDKQEDRKYVQERFREERYKNYNDATLRYERKHNPNQDRQKSEYHKIKADYLLYGIVNGSKKKEDRQELTGFIKWVVLDLHFLRQKAKSNELKIVTSPKKRCWQKDGVLYCPENFNPDQSSSFIPLDIPIINKLWSEIILAQKGYLD